MSRLTRFAAVPAALALVLPVVLGARQKRPMTIDDLLTAVRIADPQLSPDGTRVLFTRTTTALATGQRNADLWVVPADGSGPASMLIGGPKNENTARFLPDGHIAFLSSRDGEIQVYVADADGQNARAVTALSGGVQPPLVVSPDGKMVAFVSDAYPDCVNEACNKTAREAEAKDPVKMRTLTRLPFRHWDEWREELRHHVFVTDIANGSTRDLTPGDFDAPPHNYEDGAIAFSPDSRDVAFVSKRDAKDSEMWTTNHDVWTVPAAGGALKKVTPTCSPSTRRTASRFSCGRSGARGMKPTAGTSTPMIARAASSARSSRRPTSRWTTTGFHQTAGRFGSRQSKRARRISTWCRRPTARRR
jgi:dipeptidyl aminopeptidase/acylaminoacyl peptidase